MNKLAYWRARRGLTVRALSEKTQELFGTEAVSAKAISQIEKGHSRPHLSTLGKLAAALDIDLSELEELTRVETKKADRAAA